MARGFWRLGMLMAGLAGPAAPAAAAGGAGLLIERAVARVVVIPEPRADVTVLVRPAPGRPAPVVRRAGARLVVDGGQPDAGRAWGPLWLQRWLGRGRCEADRAPQAVIVARTPMDAKVTVSGAVSGQVRRADRLDLRLSGCGDWRVAEVRRDLALRADNAGTVTIDGAEDRLLVEAGGLAHVAIAGGHSQAARLVARGRAVIEHRGSIGGLAAQVRNAGVVRVREAWGAVDALVDGTGDVFYSRPHGPRYCGTYQGRC